MSGRGQVKVKEACPAQNRLKRLQKSLAEERERKKLRATKAEDSRRTKNALRERANAAVAWRSTRTKAVRPTNSKPSSSTENPPPDKTSLHRPDKSFHRYKPPTSSSPSGSSRGSFVSSKGKLHSRVKELVESIVEQSNDKHVDRISIARDADLHAVRRLAEEKQFIEAMDVDLVSASNSYLNRRIGPDQVEGGVNVHLVVDTNVLIDCTASLKQLKSVQIKSMTPILIVPWQVLKELDYLKDEKTSKLAAKARTAVNFVMNGLTSGESFVRGQPQDVADKTDNTSFKVEVPDDHLIKCCLQLLSVERAAVLLTNDKNLIAKASVCGVTAITNAGLSQIIARENKKTSLHPFEKPPELPSENNTASNNMHSLTKMFVEFLNEILRVCLKKEYGPMWLWHAPPETPPWGILTSMERVKSCLPEVSNLLEEVTQFYSQKMTNSRLSMPEVSDIAHKIFKLTEPLSTKFDGETTKLNARMASLKCSNPLGPMPGSTFLRESVQLTNNHFVAFDRRLRYFCKMSEQFQVHFPLAAEESPEMIEFNPCQFDLHFNAAVNILRALENLQTVPPDQLNSQTWAIQTIHCELRNYLKNSADEKFQADDVVQFFRCSDLRVSLSNAVHTLTAVISFLNQFKR